MRRPLPFLFAGLALILLGACNRGVPTVSTTVSWKGPIDAGAQLALRTRNGSVTVDTVAGDSVEIVLQVRRPRNRPMPTLEVLRDGADGLLACVLVGEGDRCSADGYDRERSTNGTTVTATVRIPAGRRVDVASTNGRITLVGPTASATLDTRNGSIRAQDVTGTLTARTTNGSVRVQRIVGPMTLATTNGSIRLIADTVAGDVALSTSNGGITAWLPPAAAARLSMSTSNGSATLDLPASVTSKSRTALEAVLGAGTHTITMTSTNASLAVKPRAEAEPFDVQD